MARPQRFCIFCRKPGLTYEHVWPDWLKKYVPKDMTEYSSVSVTVHQTHSEPRRKKFSGDPRNRRLRIVCKPCNTGGMGKLQERTKSYLLPLIHGDAATLDTTAQTVVSTWITMFEHDLPEIMDSDLPRPNTQTMTFTVGRLYIHVASSVTDIFENWRLTRTDLLAQIWPIQRNAIAWPLITMTDRDADQIAAAFHRMSDDVARREGDRF